MKTILILIAVSFNSMALTLEAEKGKSAIGVCMSCHNAQLNPALAPPFYGVQNKYNQAFNKQETFVKAIVDWVKKPTMEKAVMKRPIKMLGIMPAMPLPDDLLNSIGVYLYEETFDAPCTHWANDLKKASSTKKGHGNNHDAMIRMKYNQLCK